MPASFASTDRESENSRRGNPQRFSPAENRSNLSDAAAVEVSAPLDKVTDWPARFDFGDSKVLRDLAFLRPHEVIKFDLGMGPDLFENDQPAIFKTAIKFESLDARRFTFESLLKIESVAGFASWRVYEIDDVARRLEDISKMLSGFTDSKRLKVDSYSANDRAEERRLLEERFRRTKEASAHKA